MQPPFWPTRLCAPEDGAAAHTSALTFLTPPSQYDRYVEEESIDIKFAVAIVDLENPEIRGETSTYLHFALITK